MSASGRTQDFGFHLTSATKPDGTHIGVQRFICVECGLHLDRTKPTGTNNPELAAKWAKEKGWKADAWKKNNCYCPKCAGPARKPNDVDSEIRKVIPLSTTVAPIREATAEQKQRIRAALDKHFDDAVGCYLDDISDQRIAELVGVPRVLVEQIRDAAYGPIKISPELVTLRTEIAAMRSDVDEERKRVDEMTRKIADLSSRAEKMAAGKVA